MAVAAVEENVSRMSDGVLALSGYGIDLRVDRGHLIARDGVADDRREIRLSRVQPELDRIIVIGTAGTITFDALQWIHDVEAAFVQIGYDGKVISTSAPKGRGNSELLRAQALVSASAAALELSREIVTRKLEGQLAVLERIEGSEESRHALETYRDQVQGAETAKQILGLEANAAKYYWTAWRELPIRFVDPETVPEHWRTFGPRGSPYSAGNKHAVTPPNAMLNYFYAVLQAETRISCLKLGMDPGLGIFHPTRRWRDSFVFDLMEPARPVVDDYLLDLLEDRTFEKDDFFENRKGVVRVLPPLTHELSETAARWRKVVGGMAEQLARALMEIGGGGSRGALAKSAGSTLKGQILPTPLSNEYRREGRPKGDRKRRRKLQKQWARNQEWNERERDGALEDVDYEEEILPGLQDLKIKEIAEATGLSISYCSAIRSGKYVPHRRHWKTLERIAAS